MYLDQAPPPDANLSRYYKMVQSKMCNAVSCDDLVINLQYRLLLNKLIERRNNVYHLYFWPVRMTRKQLASPSINQAYWIVDAVKWKLGGDACRHAFILCNSELVNTLLCKNLLHVMIDDSKSVSINFLSHPLLSLALYYRADRKHQLQLLHKSNKFSLFQNGVIHYCKVKMMKWNHKFDYAEGNFEVKYLRKR